MHPACPPIVERIRAAAADRTPLRIRGGGTKDFYGAALHGEVLDTTPLAGILSYEPSELVVTVGGGTPLAELEAVLAASGQCLPFEPPRFGGQQPGRATVGGMVATGLSGPARASVGAVRDYVLGLTLIDGNGQLLTFGGQVMKNVAGYDVSRLMAGALGTLGVIAEVSLKVLPVAPAEATLRFDCDQAEALTLLHGWGGLPLPLNASCWMHDAAGAPTLQVRLRGAVAAVQSACSRLGGTLQSGAAATDFWTACRDQRLPWFTEREALSTHDLWRLSLPQTAPVLQALAHLPAPLVEWHGGQRWYLADAADETAARTLREAAAQAGGSATLFIAAHPGESSAKPCFDALSSPLDGIHRALKHQFDPHGVFNPGRMFADW